VTGPGDRIAAAPASHSKKLEGQAKKAGRQSFVLRTPCQKVRLTNAMPNVQKAARAYGADGCVPANKKFLTAVRPPSQPPPAKLLPPVCPLLLAAEALPL